MARSFFHLLRAARPAESPVTDAELLRRHADDRDNTAFETPPAQPCGCGVNGVASRVGVRRGRRRRVSNFVPAPRAARGIDSRNLRRRVAAPGGRQCLAETQGTATAAGTTGTGRRSSPRSPPGAWSGTKRRRSFIPNWRDCPIGTGFPSCCAISKARRTPKPPRFSNWPIGSVSGRLSRAHALLRERLHPPRIAPAAVSAALIATSPPTGAIETLHAIGIGDVPLSPSVTNLLQGVSTAMKTAKLKLALGFAAVLGGIALTGLATAYALTGSTAPAETPNGLTAPAAGEAAGRRLVSQRDSWTRRRPPSRTSRRMTS